MTRGTTVAVAVEPGSGRAIRTANGLAYAAAPIEGLHDLMREDSPDILQAVAAFIADKQFDLPALAVVSFDPSPAVLVFGDVSVSLGRDGRGVTGRGMRTWVEAEITSAEASYGVIGTTPTAGDTDLVEGCVQASGMTWSERDTPPAPTSRPQPQSRSTAAPGPTATDTSSPKAQPATPPLPPTPTRPPSPAAAAPTKIVPAPRPATTTPNLNGPDDPLIRVPGPAEPPADDDEAVEEPNGTPPDAADVPVADGHVDGATAPSTPSGPTSPLASPTVTATAPTAALGGSSSASTTTPADTNGSPTVAGFGQRELHLDDGTVVRLDGHHYVGRYPTKAALPEGIRPMTVSGEEVSRLHFEVISDETKTTIRDLGSAAGTTVERPGRAARDVVGERVPTPLTDGSVIHFGGRWARLVVSTVDPAVEP